MRHYNLYVDEDTDRRMRAAARKERSSLSKWVRKTVKRALDDPWPAGFLKALGSLEDSDLQRPDQGRFEDDAPREPL